MHLDVVERRKWLSEEEFVRALNFCHVLPGPEALQLAIYIGYKQRGYLAGAVAGALFILPSYITLTRWHGSTCTTARRPRCSACSRDSALSVWRCCSPRACASRARHSKGVLPVVLAVAAFGAFYFAHLPFIIVLLGCGLLYIATRRFGTPAAATSTFAA
jgi:chromate transporter